MELIQRSKQIGIEPSFLYTPTEHGDNINAVVTIDGKREGAGVLFWDVIFLQDHGLVDRWDEEELALGFNLTDGMVEDADHILAFVETELEKLSAL